MGGFSGASGVPKKYVDDLVSQSTAKKTFNIPSFTVPGSSYYDVNIDISDGLAGYTPAGVIGYVINGTDALVTMYFGLSSTTSAKIRVRNVSSSSATATSGTITILYTKS